MPSEIIIYKSSAVYYVAIFVAALVWIFLGINQASIALTTIIVSSFDWLLISTTILLSMIITTTLILYNWKQQIIFSEPKWNFKVREVEESEFYTLMKDYKQAYSPLIQQFDYFIFILFIITSLSSLFFPFVFPFYVQLLIYGPYLFAGLILASLFLLAMFVFRASPNSATPYFPIHPEKELRKLVTELWNTVGISWSGIRLRIGESEGYYTIQEAKAIGRIEGIEGVSSVECEVDENGFYSALSILHLGQANSDKIITLDSEFKTLESLDLDELVKRTVITYTELRGVNEILEDVLLDLGITISEKFNSVETDVLMSDDADSSDESGVADGS
jgi:hypothetical protein